MTNAVWSEGFRHRLAVLQDRYGISKAQMARQCGLPPRTLENYFKGHKPGIEALISLSRGLRRDIDWLLGEDTEDKSFNTDLVGEAAWLGVSQAANEMVKASEAGTPIVEHGKILGKEPGKFAASVEARIVKEYIALRSDYAEVSLEKAKAADANRTSVMVRNRDQ